MEFLSEIITRDKFVIEYGSHVKDGIIIVLSGRFSFTIQKKKYTAKKYDICVFNKDTLFERRVLDRIECIYIQFDDFPMPLPSGILRTTDKERSINTITHLKNAVLEKNTELINHFINDILLFRHKIAIMPSTDDSIIKECIKYFSQNCENDITLGELSRMFSLSKQGLIKRFKKHTGKTPIEYLNLVRINKAKLLLKDANFSVSDIAEKCGYDNIYYFSARFKKITGFSPSYYRMLKDV